MIMKIMTKLDGATPTTYIQDPRGGMEYANKISFRRVTVELNKLMEGTERI